ncbi:MAG: hypothetical protein JW943_14345 [Deltaproteobacteria bacterium]|nr:hypothetical protein [Deltaproteobacteria bacterium]
MNRTTRILLSLITVCWIAGSIFIYFYTVRPISGDCPASSKCLTILDTTYWISERASHQYYIDALFRPGGAFKAHPKMNPLYGICATVLLVYLLLVAYLRYVSGRKELDVRVSPFFIYLLFTFFLFATAIHWFQYYDLINRSAPHRGIMGHYAVISMGIFFIVLTITVLGKMVLNRLSADMAPETGLTPSLAAVGLGCVLLAAFLFFAGLAGQLTPPLAWGLFCVILIVGRRQTWQTVRQFFRPSVSFQSSYFGPAVWIVFVLFFIASHNVLELIRPIPIGFDDLSVYMNIPKLLAASGGELVGGVNSYPWGLVMSLGFLLFESPTIALFLSFLGGVLVFFGLYELVKIYCAKRGIGRGRASSCYALLWAALFYTLPSVIFQSAKDMKVDLPGMFFAVLSFIIFWRWEEKYGEEKESNLILLFFSALMTGFAFSIKYNFLLFACLLFLLVFYRLLKSRERISKAIVILFVFILGFGLPFSPFGIKNIVETKQITLAALQTGKGEGPAILFDPPPATGTETAVLSTALREEQQRYIGYDGGWRQYLKLPLTVTLNELTHGMYVDVGFIFLAFVPLFFMMFYWIRRDNEQRRVTAAITAAALIYWFLWAVMAKGIIWYGYAGFMFLLLMLLELLHFAQKTGAAVLKFSLRAGLIFWFLCVCFLRAAYLPDHSVLIHPAGLAYARGAINEMGYLEKRLKPYLPIMAMINKDILDHKDNPPKVYRIGTFTKYFIAMNHKTVFDDNQLNMFAILHQERDDGKTIARLKNSGFKYLIIDTRTAVIDRTPEKTLTAKYDAFVAFLKRNPDEIKVTANEPAFGLMFAVIQ